MSQEAPATARKGDRWLQIAGLAVALLTVIVTVFFAVRSDRAKEITVFYSSPRPMVSTEGRGSVSVEIRRGEDRLNSPWLLSAKIESTGNLPIEEKDIEAPVSLVFSGGKVIAAEIVQKSQPAINSSVKVEGERLSVNHKLLNPGDWISLEVLFDGKPEIPPDLSFRISGISAPKLRLQSPATRQLVLSTALPVPPLIANIVLLLAGIGSIVFALAGLVFLGSIAWKIVTARLGKMLPPMEEIIEAVSPRELGINPSGKTARIIQTLLNDSPSIQWIDEQSVLVERIGQEIPRAVIDEFGLTDKSAIEQFVNELRSTLKSTIAYRYYLRLPPGVDWEVRKKIEDIDVSDLPSKDIFKKAHEVAARTASAASVGYFGLMNTLKRQADDLMGAMLSFLFGTVLGIVILSVWRALFSDRSIGDWAL